VRKKDLARRVRTFGVPVVCNCNDDFRADHHAPNRVANKFLDNQDQSQFVSIEITSAVGYHISLEAIAEPCSIISSGSYFEKSHYESAALEASKRIRPIFAASISIISICTDQTTTSCSDLLQASHITPLVYYGIRSDRHSSRDLSPWCQILIQVLTAAVEAIRELQFQKLRVEKNEGCISRAPKRERCKKGTGACARRFEGAAGHEGKFGVTIFEKPGDEMRWQMLTNPDRDKP